MSLGPEFYNKLISISNELGMKPEDILNVMVIESGLNPAAHNRNGNASGLVQIMPFVLKHIGFQGSHADFRNLKAEEQLDYIKRLIKENIKYNGGPFKSAAQYYVSNFIPVALKLPGIKNEDPNTIIVSANPDKPHLPNVSINTEISYYNANKGLDADKDGNITYGDIQAVINKAANSNNFKKAIDDMKNYTGYAASINTKPKDNYENLFKEYTRKTFKPDNTNNILEKYLGLLKSANTDEFHSAVIKIESEDLVSSIEFARILTSALNEEFKIKSSTHINNDQVELLLSTIIDDQNLIKEFANSVASTFKIATNKIGGINIKTACFMNQESSYQPISLSMADSNYRKFLLKFIKG